jgi:hypothetical protein
VPGDAVSVSEPEALAVSDGAGELQADSVATESVTASNKEPHFCIVIALTPSTEENKSAVMAENAQSLTVHPTETVTQQR